MPQPTDDEIKARLMKEAETLIDKMLSEKKPKNEILLSDIENAAIEVGDGIRQAITGELAGERYRHEGVAPDCPDCGERMRFKDYRTRWIETTTGVVEIERAYFYCSGCRRGLFPPRPEMGTDE